jgi:hypothetical protein
MEIKDDQQEGKKRQHKTHNRFLIGIKCKRAFVFRKEAPQIFTGKNYGATQHHSVETEVTPIITLFVVSSGLCTPLSVKIWYWEFGKH